MCTKYSYENSNLLVYLMNITNNNNWSLIEKLSTSSENVKTIILLQTGSKEENK